MQRAAPLLWHDRGVGEYTRAVSRQRQVKHIPAVINRGATTEVMLETGCFYAVRAEETIKATMAIMCGSLRREDLNPEAEE
jgi:hypothetical protein